MAAQQVVHGQCFGVEAAGDSSRLFVQRMRFYVVAAIRMQGDFQAAQTASVREVVDNGGLDGGGVAGDGEGGGTGGKACEVFGKKQRLFAFDAQSFKEGEVGRGVQEGGLGLAFAVFVGGVALDGDAAANAEGGRTVVQGEGADGDVQAQAVAFDVAEGAGVDVARAAFEAVDEAHGVMFRRAGDGAAGEGGAQDGGGAGAFAQAGVDAAGHLQDAAVPFDVEGVFDADAVGDGEAAQVVTQQVNDHQVFGAVFGVGSEGGGCRCVRGIVACCGCGAFHRQGVQQAAVAGEVEFGREAEGVAVVGMVGIGGVGCRLAGAQTAVEGGGLTVGAAAQADGVVDLVAVARAQFFVDGSDGCGVGDGVAVGVQVGKPGGGAVVLCGQPGVNGLAVQRMQCGVPIQCQRRGRGVQTEQGVAEFVGDAQGSMQATRPAVGEQIVQFVKAGGRQQDAGAVVLVETGAVGAGVVKKDKGVVHAGIVTMAWLIRLARQPFAYWQMRNCDNPIMKNRL